MDPHAPEDISKHVKTYLMVFGALMVLTALTVGVSYLHLATHQQIFVALARYPHLDGQFAWLGHADGDWDAVAEGDMVQAVRVEE